MPSEQVTADTDAGGHRATIFELSDEARATIRGNPTRLLREQTPHEELASCHRLTPLPRGLDSLPQLIGGWPDITLAPETVVTGICQGGGTLEEKESWLRMGPSLEAACSIELGRAVAQHYNCRLEVWITDQEYVNTVVDTTRFTSTPEIERQVGQRVARWCADHYPDAVIRRTTDPTVRSQLYGQVMDGALAMFYPNGVAEPYGNVGAIFWQELQFLVSIAIFCQTAISGGRAIAIADHEQLRVMAGAQRIAGKGLLVLPSWPVPRLGWRAPARRREEGSTRYAERFLAAVKRDRRRMYRAQSPREMLFTEMSYQDVESRFRGSDVSSSTVREVLQYLNAWDLLPANDGVADAPARVFEALRRASDNAFRLYSTAG